MRWQASLAILLFGLVTMGYYLFGMEPRPRGGASSSWTFHDLVALAGCGGIAYGLKSLFTALLGGGLPEPDAWTQQRRHSEETDRRGRGASASVAASEGGGMSDSGGSSSGDSGGSSSDGGSGSGQ